MQTATCLSTTSDPMEAAWLRRYAGAPIGSRNPPHLGSAQEGDPHDRPRPSRRLASQRKACNGALVNSTTYQRVKELKTSNRVADMRRARRGRQVKEAIQRRNSLFVEEASWRIANLPQVGRAIARWA